VPVIAAIEGGAERDQCIDDQHDADRKADRPEQHAERAGADHFFPRAARSKAKAPPLGGGSVDRRNVSGIGSQGNASGFGRHLVQHVFNL
jgi:hypothetical protein